MKTKERPLHKIKENLPHWAELAILRNGAMHMARWTFRMSGRLRDPVLMDLSPTVNLDRISGYMVHFNLLDYDYD